MLVDAVVALDFAQVFVEIAPLIVVIFPIQKRLQLDTSVEV